MTVTDNVDFDFSRLTVAERLLLTQELLDSIYDDVTPEWTGPAAVAA